MRFLFFNDFRPGVQVGTRLHDISSFLGEFDSNKPQGILEHFIANYEELAPKIKEFCAHNQGVPLTTVRIRPPVPQPVHIVCALRNYGGGAQQQNLDFMLKSSTCVVGSGDTIRLPKNPTIEYQHEPELAVVMKLQANKISASQARDYIFGYTAFIDVSAKNSAGSSHYGKSFDTFGPMGPVLVTADEIPDPHKLAVKLWVNGEVKGDYNTATMRYHIENLVEIISSLSALLPGDVISTGTQHSAVGAMKDKDVVKMEIEGIGSMTLNVADV